MYVHQHKRECFDAYETAVKSGTTSYTQTTQCERNVRLNLWDYERGQQADMSPSEWFRVENFLPVIDQFVRSLDQRFSAYDEISTHFGFIVHLETLTTQDIEQAANFLLNKYKYNLDGSLGIELIQFAEFFKAFQQEEQHDNAGRYRFLYKVIIEKGYLSQWWNSPSYLSCFDDQQL